MLVEEQVTTQTTPPMVESGQSVQQSLPARRLRYEALLALNTLIWGSTFLVVKYELTLSGPFTYLAICYAVGALTLTLIFRRRLARITRTELRGGLALGVVLFAGYAFQTTGLQFTTVSKAGFITGLYVPLAPVFFFVFLRQRPALSAIIGIACSFVGLFLLSLNNQLSFSIGIGELLILGGAIAFAAHIVLISKFSSGSDMTNLAIIQLGLTSLLSFAIWPFAHEWHGTPPAQFWLIALAMGILDIAYTLLIMNRVQQHVGGIRATLIYAMEPLWAALAGIVLAGDVLSVPAWIGCACILAGMIVGRLG
jgi:drug/metabolite transporter (DMT)-like permease